MRSNGVPVLSFALMISVVVAADLLVLRRHFWGRLLANIGIVLISTAVYLVFLKR